MLAEYDSFVERTVEPPRESGEIPLQQISIVDSKSNAIENVYIRHGNFGGPLSV